MERLNTETLLGNKQTVNREEEKQEQTHREREKEMSRRREDAEVTNTHWTEIIKTVDKIEGSTRNVRNRKAS